jgi:ubiquinone biosynthesis UbiH/UbiF/VisC/COQ6 family hydroxylase
MSASTFSPRVLKSTVTVCGAGIVGLACALGLARRGQSVTLLGTKPLIAPADSEVFHPRVFAISPASQKFLASLGVWDMLPASRLTPIQSMEIFGDGNGHLNLRAWQNALPELAWIVEAAEIERVLIQAVQYVGLQWITEKFVAYRPGVLTTESGSIIESELIVAADGAQSPLRKAAGVSVDIQPYGVTGLVTQLNSVKPHRGRAVQWFREDGVLALLPLPDTRAGHQVSMVWSMKEPQANELLVQEAQQQAVSLTNMLAHATGGHLGALTQRAPLHGFPLTLNQSPVIDDRLALVGDAAHSLHPLAGQGLNLGLGDVQSLVEIVAGREPFRTAGDPMVLRRYRRARVEPVMTMRLVTDGLHRLFNVQAAPVVWLRNIGMNLVDKLPSIKRQIIGGASR